jgi:hypothetical protein
LGELACNGQTPSPPEGIGWLGQLRPTEYQFGGQRTAMMAFPGMVR